MVPDLHNSVPHEYWPNRFPGQSLDGGTVGGKVGCDDPVDNPVVDAVLVVVPLVGLNEVGDSDAFALSDEEPQPIATDIAPIRKLHVNLVRTMFADGWIHFQNETYRCLSSRHISYNREE